MNRKRGFFIFIAILFLSAFLCESVVLAGEVLPNEYELTSISDERSARERMAFANIAKSILDVLTYVGFAVALGVLIMIGVKFVTSPADEKARIKGLIPMFFIGIFLVIFAQAIAIFVNRSIIGMDTTKDIHDTSMAEKIIAVGKDAEKVGEDGDEETVINAVSVSFISWLKYLALAVLMGMIIFLGIQYVMSVAEVKAKIKDMLPLFVIGIFLVLFPAAIAKYVATQIAGNNKTEDVVDVSIHAGEDFGQDSFETSDGAPYEIDLEKRQQEMEEYWDSGEGLVEKDTTRTESDLSTQIHHESVGPVDR